MHGPTSTEGLLRDRSPRTRLLGLIATLLLVGLGALAVYVNLSGRRTATPSPPVLARLPGSPQEMAAQGIKQPAGGSLFGRDAALRINHAIPFITKHREAPGRFKYSAQGIERERGIDCLAAAQLYEAGNAPAGQRAVAQVVINRARHPAFPPTICGVVFQGSQRSTGCQFTFTCDGALARRYSDASWQRARAIAASMLAGATFPGVGAATHYHTDWAHPYWSAKLEKIAAVDTHLFFRWPGYWGSAKALRSAVSRHEPAIALLAFRPAHASAAPASAPEPVAAGDAAALASGQPDPAGTGLGSALIGNNRIRVIHPEGGAYLVQLGRGQAASNMQTLALRICANADFCRVMGWLDGNSVPKGFPVNPDLRAKMTFEYRRDRQSGTESIHFDCGLFARPSRDQCL